MASLLRQIVAGPRARHPEAGLDLCYVTENIIATSGPSQTYPQRAYRNPLDRLVGFLDAKHGDDWAIWEFRAEGTGYPDELVYNRIRHYPWPDHHPPPFRLVPMMMASMRNWLRGNDLHADAAEGGGGGGGVDGKTEMMVGKVLDAWKDKKNGRVIVVHCKAGKGRSGTSACSFLISECGWTPEQALARFTERRMRPQFGPGVSIPSQLRWVGYVDRWTKGGKKYADRELEIVEIHVWGLRHGVKVDVEGFIDEGKKIKVFHTFTRDERHVVEGDAPGASGLKDTLYDMAGYNVNASAEQKQESLIEAAQKADESYDVTSSSGTPGTERSRTSKLISPMSRKASKRSLTKDKPSRTVLKKKQSTDMLGTGLSRSPSLSKAKDESEPGGQAVIFRPREPVRLPSSDVNISIERRNRAPSSMGLTMVTAVAHVWFNAFFEGNGPEQDGKADDAGVFEIEWDKLDGIKGSSQKGTRALDRMSVVWRSVVVPERAGSGRADSGGVLILEPGEGSPVPQMEPADWKGANDEDPGRERKLGLRGQSPDGANVSRASSLDAAAVDDALGKAAAGLGLATDDGEADRYSLDDVKTDVPAAGGSEAEAKDRTASEEVNKQVEARKLEAYAEKLPNPEGGQG